MMSEQIEGKYLIPNDKQHKSVINLMTGVVLFGFEKLQHKVIPICIQILIYLYIYLIFIYSFIIIHRYIDNVCIIAMFAC